MTKLTELKLYADIQKLTPNKWYGISAHPEYELMVKFIKSFIDMGEDLEFSNDYKRFKVISHELQPIEVNWETVLGIRTEDNLCPPDKYGKQAKYRQFYFNDKLVGTQSL